MGAAPTDDAAADGEEAATDGGSKRAPKAGGQRSRRVSFRGSTVVSDRSAKPARRKKGKKDSDASGDGPATMDDGAAGRVTPQPAGRRPSIIKRMFSASAVGKSK
jgi:hypothetical protein